MTQTDSYDPESAPHTVVTGHIADVSHHLPTEIARCVITSPPYFGHRTYSEGDERELGREDSVDEYVERLVKMLGQVRDQLYEDGTLWLNLGDTYRNKQLLGIPWRVALRMKDDGWILRSDIIWHKPNAMPSSVTSRPTVDHEYLFLFSKADSYQYNADAIREPHVTFSSASKMKGGRNHFGKRDGTPEAGKNAGNNNLHDARWDQAFHPLGRNRRTVWSVPLGKFRGAHFAVFPERLVEPCILAGSSEGDLVMDPFAGSGTVGVVAKRLNRRFLGVELVPEYATIARQRVDQTAQGLPGFT